MSQVRRRKFLFTAGALVAVPFAAIAQQSAKVWRVGFLGASWRQIYLESGRLDAFLRGMRELGYVEGKNLVIEWRFADGKYERLPALATELVRLNPDVIVAEPSPAIRAAKQATKTIPIVFPMTGDPVGSGFVASLARPGGNVTGMANLNLDLSAKLLELLRELAPSLSRITVLLNPGSSTAPRILTSIQAAARTLNVEVLPIEAHTVEEIERAFPVMAQWHAEAVVIATDSFLIAQGQKIGALALKHGLPSITQSPFYAEAGGLMSYGQNLREAFRYAAVYVDKILKGARPADLPVEQASKLELVVNVKTARELGLKIPQSILLRADRVIE
ncbi:MAG: ABC transporter substrate-binding protein [Betaproteobacteria bacterium]|nr:ABC transporter substrate-binding protein [Betaproteobacteria bacterium]